MSRLTFWNGRADDWQLHLVHYGVTPFAVVQWEGNVQVAGAAELAAKHCFHGEILGPFLIQDEYFRVAVAAVQLLTVNFVGEDDRRN